MDIAEALQIVIDLAKQNALDDVSNPEQADEAHRQQEAIAIIEDLAINEYGDD
ncbi:hypothetical protein [Mesorhizobium sp. CN2-181]|uniref:hypothetical protein n=1 Tax=Mesorhizobium yinganensis TaxID=3157707 RepID=UPI0032B7FA6B